MTGIPRSTLEQWAVLRAVVELGGFAPAAAHLNRSQSSVSYAVDRLEERLGLPLLRIEGRKARLTESGRALLAEALPLIDELLRLEARSRLLVGGQEASLRLLIDSLFPRSRLFAALARFQTQHPLVRVDLCEIVRRPAAELADRPFDLAVTLWDSGLGHHEPVLDVEMVAVAHRSHPLQGREASQAELDRHLRVVIHGQEGVVENGRIWQVNTVEAGIEAVGQGLCYGWLPRYLIEPALAAGELMPLALAAGATRRVPLVLIYADPARAGLATKEMAALLKTVR